MREDKHRGPEQEPENEKDMRKKKPDKHSKKKKKRRKKHHHFFLWILLLILIIGILLGILIDQGIIKFPGGEGWIGGAIGTITDRGQNNGTDPTVTEPAIITPVLTPVATQAPNYEAADAHIKISKDKVYMNDVEIQDINELPLQLKTDIYRGGHIYLKDEYATKVVYDNVKTLLLNNGLTDIIEE